MPPIDPSSGVQPGGEENFALKLFSTSKDAYVYRVPSAGTVSTSAP